MAQSPPAAATPLPPCLVVTGPTASGKTAFALALAEACASGRQVEIVSVDSALVYRGMDIGTAKPSAAERAAVPHHLIDLLDPAERYSAARFVADARAAMIDIRSRGRLPLLVGGTLLYLKALFDGLDAMPAADPIIRAELEAEAALHGWAALHARLAEIDPATAARLPPGDTQRIQRALEVHRLSGRPISSFHTAQATAAWPPVLSLEPADRAWLHRRIDARFDAMLDHGLVDEVRGLRARGDLTPELPSMRCVGYRQAWAALDRGDLSRLSDEGRAATRQLAKRQLTGLRGLPQRRVVVCDDGPAMAAALARAVDLARREAD